MFEFSKKKLPKPKQKPPSNKELKPFSVNLFDNDNYIKDLFEDSYDLSSRNFILGEGSSQLEMSIYYINGLTDKSILEMHVLKPLSLNHSSHVLNESMDMNAVALHIKNSILTTFEIVSIYDLTDAKEALLVGKSILMLDGIKYGFELDTRKWKDRNITEPSVEPVIRGPHEGFTETLLTNTALLRRRIKTTDFVMELVKLGNLTKTDIVISYIKGVVDDKIVQEVRERISKIDTDCIIDSGYVEQFIEDAPYSIFSTIGHTEKPDIAAAKLMEGRVVIIVDGSPAVLTLPYLFIENLQASDDYYMRPFVASFLRLIRVISLFVVLFLPGFYIAVQTYHPDLLPTHLLITMAAAKEGVPFPAYIEIFGMSILFEILKEAGRRMPRSIGQAVNIVGALVIGQAAVDAGFVSSPAVMITALAGIAGFVIYTFDEPVTLLRFIFIFVAGFAGLFGLMLGILFLLIHLVSLRSFGVPFMSPIAPVTSDSLIKDTLFRAPLWTMSRRPQIVNWKSTSRDQTDKLGSKKK
ncbi:MAG: spore germination protein [Vallitaleaceae bacterium]|nr:spore germination protein [Vallitaleaceae bacterium]